MTYPPQRGFTLLISIILATVALVVGLALADVAYKQVLLSVTTTQSQTAFYAADSALECALYYDQQFAAFNPGIDFDQNNIRCENRQVRYYSEIPYGNGGQLTTFTLTCPGYKFNERSADVTIYKEGSGATCSATGATSCLYTSGYNTCNENDPNRFERGLKVLY